MGSVNWVYTVQRQPAIYPTGHGSNSGTNVPRIVGEGTLIYPAGGPAGGPPKNRDQLPLWHSVYFRNEFNCSYYNMKMIRRGVLAWGHFQSLEDVRLLNALPRTWKGVYNHGGRLLNKIPSKGGFDTPTVHVQNWTRAWLLQFYASQPGLRDPQTPKVWEQWANAQLPPRVKDFAQRVLWHKLTVHEGVYKRSGTDKCPICSQKESIKHAMVQCSMFKAAAAVIQHYYGPVETGDGKSPVRDMMESDQQEWLLARTKAGQCGRQEVPIGDTDVKLRQERHQCSRHI